MAHQVAVVVAVVVVAVAVSHLETTAVPLHHTSLGAQGEES